MVAVFAAPVLATWFYFFFPQYLPGTRSNRGELLSPPVALPAGLALTGPSGAPFDPARLEGAWTLVYLANGGCGPACIQRLTEIRQIRLALGEGQRLVERLLLVGAPQGPLDQALMNGAFDGMHLAQTDGDGLSALLGAMGSGPEGQDRLYLLDPRGNLMMRYAADAPPKDTLKDLERLIKASKSWIKGASYGHN
jgi:cytochrome oxidase Cu insertion factor (SCO1/SenC/PrrC family)